MKNLSQRLSSRKFLLALSAAITLYAGGDVQQATAVVLAYVFAEAGIDVSEVVKGARDAAQRLEDAGGEVAALPD